MYMSSASLPVQIVWDPSVILGAPISEHGAAISPLGHKAMAATQSASSPTLGKPPLNMQTPEWRDTSVSSASLCLGHAGPGVTAK